MIKELMEIKSKRKRHNKSIKFEKQYGLLVGQHCVIGKNFNICHYEGIIIGDRVQIGDNCNIYQHVTLGQKNGQYPIIGNNVTMYPGCVIIGGITVGDNVVVAPNAVVIQDVPADTIVGGIPAHIIKRL